MSNQPEARPQAAPQDGQQTMAVERVSQLAQAIEQEVARVIVGQHEVVRQVLVSLLAGGHALLEGVPGLGKTVLVKTLGQALELKFARVQFTPDLMPADIVGTDVLTEDDSGRRGFAFRQGPVFTNLLLADEINRATPKTQSALLEAMQERTVTVGDATRTLPHPFFVLATQNPVEMEGTYPLPEAQLDRFLLKVQVPFPRAEDMVQILGRTTGVDNPEAGRVASGDDIRSIQKVIREVPMAEPVVRYAVALIMATHPEEATSPELVRRYVRFGSSPRGLQALALTAKVRALLSGRYNVAYEDLRAMAYPVLRHRVLLNFEGQAEGLATDQVIAQVLEQVQPDAVPVGRGSGHGGR